MTKPNPNIRKLIYHEIMADLEPGPLVVHGKVGLSISVGGFLSLMLCGQFGVALTPFADAMRGQLMSVMGILGCTVTCGLIFSLLPVFILRCVTSPVQFYVLTRKKWSAIMGWMIGSGIVFMLVRSQGGAWDLILWSLAAAGTFFGLAGALRLLTRQGWFSRHDLTV